ncbi:glycosyltransferase [Swingsia samuiensis]|uniref:Glycosyltransferase n=1 Tax=Swingsia samuiensis TaxID=1293412 RepID=A0A4Y6UH60_9PROT|nr:glycosyltransferase [Swingsia samuiensis]QDH16913.1 glycosyltransferase [Swingsia samuiensis]
MHIVYIVSSFEGGGAEFAIPDIVKALQGCGHQVSVVGCTLGDGMACSRLDAAGIAYKVLGQPNTNRWKRVLNLLSYVKAKKPDLIWTSLPKATLDGQIIGKLLKIPVISWQHSAFTKRYKEWAMPFLQRLSHYWISDSASVSQYLKARMKVKPSRIIEWPIFIAHSDWPQSQLWDGQTPLRIGSLGRLHYHKDYPTLLRAYAHLRNIAPDLYKKSVLIIAGAGPDKEALQKLAVELGIENQLELVGHLEDPSQFLASLHVYVQPFKNGRDVYCRTRSDGGWRACSFNPCWGVGL